MKFQSHKTVIVFLMYLHAKVKGFVIVDGETRFVIKRDFLREFREH